MLHKGWIVLVHQTEQEGLFGPVALVARRVGRIELPAWCTHLNEGQRGVLCSLAVFLTSGMRNPECPELLVPQRLHRIHIRRSHAGIDAEDYPDHGRNRTGQERREQKCLKKSHLSPQNWLRILQYWGKIRPISPGPDRPIRNVDLARAFYVKDFLILEQ